MGWMADEYAQIGGQAEPAVFTCKPIALGGPLGRADATARGGYYLVRHLARGLGLNGTMRVAIQGFGNAGQHIARLLAADGHAIVAVSDSNGAVKADGGLDLERLVAAKDGGGSVASTAGQAGPALLPGDELGGVACDPLAPAPPHP